MEEQKQNTPVQVKEISDHQKLMAYWAAHGWTPEEIAKELGYGVPTIKKNLKDKRVKLFAEKIRYKIYGEDPALHIKSCAQKAIGVAEEIMENKKIKPHVRLLAAQDFMNREYGKAAIDDGIVEGTVRKILTMLQSPPKPEEPEKIKDIEDAEYSEVPQETKKLEETPKNVDQIDDWLDKNMK